jgi:hypothetical protein
MKKLLNKITLLFIFIFCISCGSSPDRLKPSEGESSSLESEGNAIDQTNPTLMIFPSDALLKRVGCLKEIENQGTVGYLRDYGKAYINDSELKFVIASVEESFAKIGYPLENLEQQLKQINNDNTMDAMEGVSKDSRTMILNTARPDFIIEVDYEFKQDPASRNPKKILSYIVTALDSYTNKSIASITRANEGKENENLTLANLIKEDLTNNLSDFQKQIKDRFKDELANGVEITLRLTTDGNSTFSFGDECLGSENYNDWINSWLKKNTVNSTFKPVKNTDKELRFTNVRISAKTESGDRFTAFDFANKLKSDFSKACGTKATNRTQGIGDAYLVISGLK